VENLNQKIQFLRIDFVKHLGTINPNTLPLFGKMNPQQMVEHMAEYIRMGYGNPRIAERSYSDEIIDKMNAFLKTEKPLRPNTGNPLMEETPAPAKLKDYEAALQDVAKAIDEFFVAFEQNPKLIISNPFFGNLDFSLTVQLLYKHSQHHLRQFGVLN
jgi:hypothetical protein